MPEPQTPFDQAVELAALRHERAELTKLLTAYQSENAAVRAEVLRLGNELRRKGLTKTETWMVVIMWLLAIGLAFLGAAMASSIEKDLRRARRLQEAAAIRSGFTDAEIRAIYGDMARPLKADDRT